MKLFDIFGVLKIKGLDEAKKGLEDVASGAEKTGSIFNRVWQSMKQGANSIWSGVRSKAKSTFSGIGSDANSLSGRIRNAFSRIKLPQVLSSAFKSSLKSAESLARSTANSIKNTLGGIKNAFSGMTGVLAGVGVAMGTKEVFNYANSLDQARINWKVLTGSAEEGEKMLQRIQQFAKDTPFDFDSTQKFAQQLKIAGLNGDQLFKTMQVIGDAAQGNVEKAEGIATAYQQMSAKGKIQTEEMNQLLERGIPAWDMLSKATGKTKAELMDMASKGKLMADEYLPKLVEQMDKAFGGGMQEQAKTFNGQMNQLEDNLLMLGARGIEPLRNGLKNLMADINDVFDGKMSVSEMFSKWGRQFKDGLTKLGESIANFDLTSFLKKLFNSTSNFGTDFLSDIFKGLKNLVDGIVRFIENIDFGEISRSFQNGLVGAVKALDLGSALAWLVNIVTRLLKALIKSIREYDYSNLGATLGKLIRQAISNLWEFLQDVDWLNILSLLWEGFKTALEALFIDLPMFLANLITSSLTGMSLEEIGEAISNLFSNMGEWISEKFNELMTWFGEQGSSIGEAISSWWDSMSESLSTWWQNIVEWLGEKAGDLVKAFVEFPEKASETIGTWWGSMSESFSTWWQNIGTWISEKFAELVQWFRELPSKIANWGIWIWDGITSGLATFWQSVTTWISEKFNQLVGWFRELPSKIADWGTRIWNGISGSLASMWGTVTGWFTEKFNQLVGWFREAPSKVAEFGSWIWNSISNGLNTLWENVRGIGKNIVEGVWNGITSAADWFYGQISGFFSGLIDRAKSALGINSPSRKFRDEIGQWLPPGIAEGVIKNSDVAIDSISSLSEQMVNAWDGEFNTNLTGYGTMSFDSETSAPFKVLSDKFNELLTAFNNIEFKGAMIVDGEHLGEAVFTPLNNLIEEGGLI